MGKLIYVYDNVLNDKECEFLIRYFNRHYNNEENTGNNFSRILTLTLNTNWRTVSWTHWFHIRVNLIRRKCLRRVMEEIPLKLQYDQLVHWSSYSFMESHYDNENTPWASICYLNDDYSGGETVIEDKIIKPKRGTMVVWSGRTLFHGVKEVMGNRYTYTSWFEDRFG